MEFVDMIDNLLIGDANDDIKETQDDVLFLVNDGKMERTVQGRQTRKKHD